MYNHPPSALAGPLTQTRPWWVDDETTLTSLAPSLCLEEAAMTSPDDDLHRHQWPIRWELVNRVRQEITDGTYETPEKWDVALDRLMDRLEDRDNA
jgi:hypothetical protein